MGCSRRQSLGEVLQMVLLSTMGTVVSVQRMEQNHFTSRLAALSLSVSEQESVQRPRNHPNDTHGTRFVAAQQEGPSTFFLSRSAPEGKCNSRSTGFMGFTSDYFSLLFDVAFLTGASAGSGGCLFYWSDLGTIMHVCPTLEKAFSLG